MLGTGHTQGYVTFNFFYRYKWDLTDEQVRLWLPGAGVAIKFTRSKKKNHDEENYQNWF